VKPAPRDWLITKLVRIAAPFNSVTTDHRSSLKSSPMKTITVLITSRATDD
jgi:hypothetical protein